MKIIRPLSSLGLGFVPDPRLVWWQTFWQRIQFLWWLKAAGTCLFMWVFFSLYFSVMRITPNIPLIVSLSKLDKMVDFSPEWLWMYLSLWFYTSLAPALTTSIRQLLEYGVYIGGLCIVGLLIFYFFPTQLNFDSSLWQNYETLRFLKKVDIAGNAFPSLHVASAIFTAYYLQTILSNIQAPRMIHFFNVIWCLGIIYSTLAIKQHVVWDLVGGAALSGSVCFIHRFFNPPERLRMQ